MRSSLTNAEADKGSIALFAAWPQTLFDSFAERGPWKCSSASNDPGKGAARPHCRLLHVDRAACHPQRQGVPVRDGTKGSR
jgi:hypothetical protein